MPFPTSPKNSTNVRTDAPRGAIAALVAWTAFVAFAGIHGVFARVGAPTLGALALFASLFAVAAYGLDAEVREWVDRAGAGALVPVAMATDAALALAAIAALRAGLAPGAWPCAVGLLCALPAALVASLAAARAGARRLSSAPGRSPGARPAAP